MMPLALLALCSCANFWDEVTSHDFKWKSLWAKKPDPIEVAQKSGDGDHRGKAILRLKEPKANHGTDEQQELVMDILLKSATMDRQPYCRLAAIQKLGEFKDPRAVKGLQDAYFNATDCPGEGIATRLQCQAIASLGETRNPAAIRFLIDKLKEPPADRSDLAMQRSDRCTAAARALANFKDPQAIAALAQALQKEKNDIALRDRIHGALMAETGKNYPPDSEAWAQYLNPDNVTVPAEDKRILPVRWLTR
jgi:hypothetical protein